MKFYDLFAGIGGFMLGLERCGHECVGSCEIAEYPRIIYERHFGEKPELDACRLDAGKLPDFDILAAGFPCQAFSTAGKRLGFADARGTLFYEIARIAKQKRPRLLFLENVAGLLYHEEGRTFGSMLCILDELGYDAEWQVLYGSDHLPQERPRVFIVGHLRERSTRQVFPLGEPASEDDGADNEAETLVAMRAHTKANILQRIQRRRTVWTLDTQNNKQAIAIALPNHKTVSRYMKTEGEPMFTLTSKPDVGVYDGQRFFSLMPIEWERLQGFPEGWTEGIPERARYHCLGNAVMPPVVQYIASHF